MVTCNKLVEVPENEGGIIIIIIIIIRIIKNIAITIVGRTSFILLIIIAKKNNPIAMTSGGYNFNDVVCESLYKKTDNNLMTLTVNFKVKQPWMRSLKFLFIGPYLWIGDRFEH